MSFSRNSKLNDDKEYSISLGSTPSFLRILRSSSIVNMNRPVNSYKNQDSDPFSYRRKRVSGTPSGVMSRAFRLREPAKKQLHARTNNFELEMFRRSSP